MKIFEVTEKKTITEAPIDDLKALLGVIKSKKDSAASGSDDNAGAQSTAGPDDGTRGSGDPDEMLDAVADQVRSGEAEVNKIVDAELGKYAADPQDIHVAVVSKTQEAARSAARQIAEQTGLSGQEAIVFIRNAQLQIRMALFGYINKKYLNGDDQNFQGNTMDIITRALQSQQPSGGAQPAGRQSSARTQGQQGTVPSGGGTNALDQAADDRLRNRDF